MTNNIKEKEEKTFVKIIRVPIEKTVKGEKRSYLRPRRACALCGGQISAPVNGQVYKFCYNCGREFAEPYYDIKQAVAGTPEEKL